MPIVLLFLFSLSLHAATLRVQDNLKTYTLSYSEEKISLTASDLDYTVIKNSCNAHILKRFNYQMKKVFTTLPMMIGSRDNAINYHLLGKNFYEPFDTRRAVLLREIPSEVKRMQSEERILCQKAK